jgi:hypothetical protein
MAIKLNGLPFTIAAPLHARRLELREFLDKHRDTVFTRKALAPHGFSHGLVLDFGNDERFLGYAHKDGSGKYYGCPAAIEECKKEIKRLRGQM